MNERCTGRPHASAPPKRYREEVTNRLANVDLKACSLPAAIDKFNKALLGAARVAAPFGSVRKPKAWWSEACERAHRAVMRAFRRVQAQEPGAAEDYAAARHAADVTYCQEKRHAWRRFTQSLDTRTSTGRVWNVLKAMDGRSRRPLPDTPLIVNDGVARDDCGKSKAAAAHYARVSRLKMSKANNQPACALVRRHIKNDVGSRDQIKPFSATELAFAMRSSRGRSPGADDIQPDLLRQLPESGRHALLELLNRSWCTGDVPACWKAAIIVPILKKDKPTNEIKSYRPVSLLPLAVKLLERMVMARLNAWQRRLGLVPAEQAGFQQGRSTIDCVAQLVQPAFDALQPKRRPARSLLVAIDFKAAFDTVWRPGLLAKLAAENIPSSWLRWLRSWLADRRACVRWNDTLSRPRCMSAGVPQGSPLSPLLFDLFVADLPDAIRATSPSVDIIQYADDVTLVARDPEPSRAADKMQVALDSLSRWSATNAIGIAAEKTEALVVSVDPCQVNAKVQPRLVLNGTVLRYNPQPKILGVTLDSQLRFGPHARLATKRLDSRLNICKALSGTTWGADERTLRDTYVGYVRPAAMYAAGVWMPFLSACHVNRLEAKNNAAARTIVGAPAGSNAVATCREAGLLPLALVAKREAAALLLRAQRYPSAHVLHRLTITLPNVPRRLRNQNGGFRSSWFDVARSALGALPAGYEPEPWPEPDRVLAPWEMHTEHTVEFLLAGGNASKTDQPSIRRQAALNTLEDLRSGSPTAVEIWSDGAAKDGVKNGGAGCFIKWHNDQPPTTLSCAAGSLTTSTGAETTAAWIGLSLVASTLAEERQRSPDFEVPAIRLLFDSRALFFILQRPAWRQTDRVACEAVSLLNTLAEHHDVAVVWVPGHAGIEENEAADSAATLARDRKEQSGTIFSVRVLDQYVANSIIAEWDGMYDSRCGDTAHVHYEASDGGRLPPFDHLLRHEAVMLHQLRLGRAPWLRATQHRWGQDGADNPSCVRCNSGQDDDTPHFLRHCSALDAARLASFGAIPSLDCLQDSPSAVLKFIELAGVL